MKLSRLKWEACLGNCVQSFYIVKAKDALIVLDNLSDDSAVIKCYIDGELVDKTVSELAQEAKLQITG
ncbi:MAG TPA: hypothetical protein VJL89_10670 [Thermodesulfovibrionia bacterium]|nr:hypothetical protein [Thermodesulfovibrionia bacterium]